MLVGVNAVRAGSVHIQEECEGDKGEGSENARTWKNHGSIALKGERPVDKDNGGRLGDNELLNGGLRKNGREMVVLSIVVVMAIGVAVVVRSRSRVPHRSRTNNSIRSFIKLNSALNSSGQSLAHVICHTHICRRPQLRCFLVFRLVESSPS